MVVYNDAGQPETVQYRKVNAMLLNEVQRQHRQIEAQQEQLEALRTRLAAVERRLDTKGVPRLKPAKRVLRPPSSCPRVGRRAPA